MLRKEIWECPFCNTETIKVAIRPATMLVKRTGMRSGRKTQRIRFKGEIIILSEECSNCKKQRKEIIEKYKEMGYV